MNSLRSKLVFSYLAIALLTAALIYGLIYFTVAQRLKTAVLDQELIELQAEVERWYEAERNWDGFNDYFLALHPPPPGKQAGANAGSSADPPPPPRGQHGIVDNEQRLLNRYLNFSPGEIVPEVFFRNEIAIVVEGETVAWILPDDDTGISLQAEQQIFLQNAQRGVLIAAVMAVCVAILVGIWLANLLLRPITALTNATQRMTLGELQQEIALGSKDELGQLAESFNSMSQELSLATMRRKQMTADIAHDLSTPLHIASGYIDTMLDGDLAPTNPRLSIVATELNHLRRLIEDLDLLALTDNKDLSLHLEPIVLETLLTHVVNSFQTLAVANNIQLVLELPEHTLPTLNLDSERLMQVLGNIINNAIRFTPANGTIVLSAIATQQSVTVTTRDSGVGIAPDQLPFVFDRFYQEDKTRAQSGKMGLGLAISKGLTEAMGGQISADSQGLNQGTSIQLTFPAPAPQA